MVPDLLVLAIDYYRAPLRYTDLSDPLQPLPDSFENLVAAFGSALSPRGIEKTSKSVGMRPEEVEKAFSLFGPVLNGADGIQVRLLFCVRFLTDPQVRDGRNGCYAFVTFENCSSAAEAIEKGAIVQGKRVYVEPRYQRQDPVEQKYPVPAMAMPPAPRTGMPQMTPPQMMPQMTPH